MKDSKGYLEKMEKSMQEKLFFIERLDLNNKILIDFGCANAVLIQRLMEMNFKNTTFVGVESNPMFLDMCKELENNSLNFKAFGGLLQVELYLKALKEDGDNRGVILLCSSVLHELSFKYQEYITMFAHKFCDHFVIRDMIWLDRYGDMPLEAPLKLLHKIIRRTNDLEHFQDFFRKRDYSFKSIAEYLLKYRYVENWETEMAEDYMSVDWRMIRNFANESCCGVVVYENVYTNTYIADHVMEDFYIDMYWPTHCQMIIEILRRR